MNCRRKPKPRDHVRDRLWRGAARLANVVSDTSGYWRLLALIVIVLGPAEQRLDAAEKTFTLGSVAMTLEDVSALVDVRYQSMRLNRALNVWNVEASLTNKSNRMLEGPFLLLVESFAGTGGPLQVDGSDPESPTKKFYDLSAMTPSGRLLPGERSVPRTLTLAFSSGSPNLVTKIFAAPNRRGVALGLVRSLNEVGQPLVGVQIEESGPVALTNLVTDPVFGVATVGQREGAHVWKFSASGYLPVWRKQNLSTGEVVIIVSPRLTQRSTNAAPIAVLDGGRISNSSGSIQVTFSAGAVTQVSSATLTPLSGQTLPALLPLGWSPLQSFWMELSEPLTTPATVSLKPNAAISDSETAALVRLNESTLEWEVAQLLTGNGTNIVTAPLGSSGAYALVVPDAPPQAPAPAQIGEALRPNLASLPNPSLLVATGSVAPSSSPASRVAALVTSEAEVMISHSSDALPSGLVLRGEVSESYRLNDGTRRHPPQYENFLIGYQRPGDTSDSTLHAKFPLRPLFLFGSEDLEEATVKMDVLTPSPFAGSVLDHRGGQVTAEGLRIIAGNNDISGNQAAQLRRLNPTNFLDLVPTNISVVAAFDHTVTGVSPGRRLATQVAPLPTNAIFVLARVLYDQGQYGLQPLERFSTDGLGRLVTAEPTLPSDRLDGLIGAGQYLLLQVKTMQALVTGVARNSAAQPTAGMPVRITGQPWLAFSGTDGSFKLLAPTGSVDVAVTDLTTGDTGQQTLVISDPNAPVTTGVESAAAGPRVISINPTNGSVNVARVISIEISFSEAINPGSLGTNGIQLVGTNDAGVRASVILNLRNTVVTLLPIDQLDSGSRYTVVLSTNITDRTGLRLEGQNRFVFDTQKEVARGDLAKLTIFEPGATNIPAAILGQLAAFEPGQDKDIVVASGSPGSAEAEVAVILVNETTGETSTVLSNPDGSFAGFVHAAEDDFISAVFVNANGTRIVINAREQRFDDGKIGLYKQGGILEAESDGGPIQVIVEPGAIPTRTKFKLEPFKLTELLTLLNNTPPTNATLLGSGLQLSTEGDELTGPIDVSIPISRAELEQAGITNSADRPVFALVAPATLQGDPVYVLVDGMELENGRLVTKSPPFPGAGSLLRPPDRVREALQTMLLLNLFPKSAPAADAAANSLAVAPLLLASRSQPAIFSGKVFEAVANEAGTEVAGIRPLAGALVTLNAVGGFSQGRPGRLIPGSICCVSGANGAYALRAPVPDIGTVLNPGGSAEEFMLMASHPSRLQQIVQLASSPAAQTITRLTDLIFPALVRGSGADSSPPRVSVFHNPTFPSPGIPAQFVVLASHGSGQPAVTLTAESAVPSNINLQSDVQVSLRTREAIGPTAVRSTFDVLCKSNAIVTFRASAEVSEAPRSDVPYAVAFSGSGFEVEDPVPSDLNDSIGPRVLRSVPRNDLAQTAPTLAPGDPILIEFNEAISKSVIDNPGAVQLSPSAGNLVKELSSDQRVLTIRAYALEPAKNYTLTLSSQITDIVSDQNRLDQNPLTDDPDPFILRFQTAPIPSGSLSEIESGGGAVLRGIHAYVLERAGSLDGAVAVYDLSNPQAPQKVAEISVPGFPRDLALIPKYSFKRGLNGPAETKDLLAVVGGKVGGAIDDAGQLMQGFQYLWIIDIEDPDDPVRVAAAAVTLSPSAALTKVQWSPPFVAYLESDANSQAISLLNLQSFILSSYLAPNEFSPTNNFGVDANGDGDFVDLDDKLPIPFVSRGVVAGKIAAFGLQGNTQRIIDFDWISGEAFLGVTVSPGNLLDLEGNRVASLSAGYLTMSKRFIQPRRDEAFLPITDGNPKRVSMLFGVNFLNSAGQPRIADFALVSVVPNVGLPRIDVIDVSDPSRPALARSIDIPARHGIVQSIKLRDDGLLMVATTSDMLLLDPSRLTASMPQGGTIHPSFVGMIPGLGSGARSFGGSTYGLHVVSLGGQNVVKQTSPRISFVAVPEPIGPDNPEAFHPDDIRDDPQKVASALSKMRRMEALPPARFRPNEDCDIASTISPPSPSVHYYVLVEAPGSAGDTIELALETLNESGYPNRNKGRGFPAVRAMTTAALQKIRQQPRLVDAPIRSLTAYRLSPTNTDPTFNLYLSKPFALVCEPMTRSEIEEVRDELDREILWSGHYLRAYFDYSLSPEAGDNKVVGPFAGVPDEIEKVMRPGTVVIAESMPADYFTGPNPPAVIGHAALPSTFGSIAAHNGEFRTDTTDFTLPSRRMGIVFQRVIGGQDLYEGPFGRGWDFNYNQRIVSLRPELLSQGANPTVIDCNEQETGKPGDLLFYNGAGRVLVYKHAGTNPPPEFQGDPLAQQLQWLSAKTLAYFHSPTGAFDMIVQFDDQRFGRLLPDGTQFWYSPAGRLERIYHRYIKNFHVLHYNDRGDLVRIEDRSVDTPRYLDIGYYREQSEAGVISPTDKVTSNIGEVGKIHRLVDYTRRDVQFEYSERGELILRKSIEVTVANQDGFTGRQRTHYHYGIGANELPQFPLANDITGIIAGDPDGAPLVSISGYAAGAAAPTARTIAGAQGLVQLEILYNNTAADLAAGNGRLRLENPDGAETAMDLSRFGFPAKTEFSGNGAGLVAYQTIPNTFGLPTEMHYPRGNKVIYTYQTTPNLRSKPNITRIERLSAGGEPPLNADMEYDPKYNFQSGVQRDANGNAITYTPASEGLDIGEINYPAVSVQLPPGMTSSIPLGLGAREISEFNQYGQLQRQVDVNGVVRRWVFDPADGFVTDVLRGEGTNSLGTRMSYSDLPGQLGLPRESIPPRLASASTRFTYDEREQLVTLERGAIVSRSSYDENGHVVRRSSTVDPGKELVETREYLHNGFLNAKRLLEVETGTQQALQSLVVSNTPDAMFRVIKVTYPGGEFREYKDLDHLGRPRRMLLGDYEETYDYDDNNNLRSVTIGTAEPAMTEFVYDGHDRLQIERRPVSGQLKEETIRSYFDSGALKEITVKAADGSVLRHTQFHIDALGRTVASVTDSDNGPVVQTSSFDGNARIRRTMSAGGEVLGMRYDDAGRPLESTNSTQAISYAHDKNDNVEHTESREGPIGQNIFRTEYTPFDSLDRSEQLADTEGRISSFAYRLDGRVSQTIDGRGNPQIFTYTRLGEPILRRLPSGVEFHRAYDRNRQATLEGDREDQGWSYTYDSSVRLSTHALRDTNTYTFSNFDNRNQPQTVSFPGMTVALGYDLQGRLLSRNSTYLGRNRSETNSYDALDRIIGATFNGGSVSNRYDLLGPLREMRLQAGANTYAVQYGVRRDGVRTNIAYSSSSIPGGTVGEQRDVAGRLLSVLPDSADPVVFATGYEAAALIGQQTFGSNLIDCANQFDGRKRLFHRKYTRRPDGKVLAEIRYSFDSNNNVIARQSLHRGGRTDFFRYDADDRLIRADSGVRPEIPNAASRQVAGFVVPSDVVPQSPWSPGLFARAYVYDGQMLDRLTSATALNPDSLVLPAFATSIGGFDSVLHAGTVDSFVRQRDPMGNTTNTLLHVRVPGSAAPLPVAASLQYDAKGQLVRVVRADGVQVEYEYLHSGLCHSRKVTGPASLCVPSERIFVWDGPRLLEEYDLTPQTKTLRARYFYTDSDVPVAADLTDAAGTLQRIYFLIDIQGSILATVNATGEIIERYAYDAWGQPQIESSDTEPPVVRQIVSAPDGLLIEFSERVLPPLIQPVSGATNRELVALFASLAAGLSVEQAGAPVAGRFIYEESKPGFAVGTVIRFEPSSSLAGSFTLRAQAGIVNDEWNNSIAGQTINFTFNSAPGTQLFANLAFTSSSQAGRTVFEQPFLFHGQYFDFEAGLIYMRARHYDPFIGMFLQPDPAGYADSVNLYAGFANNPQSFRDPSGNLVFVPAIAAIGAVLGGAIAGAMEYMDQGEFNKDVLFAAGGGAVAGAFAGFTAGGSLLVEGAILGAASGIAGGATELYFRGGQYTPELAVQHAFTGSAGGIIGAVGGRAVGAVIKSVKGSLDGLPGGMIDGSLRGRVAPTARQVPDAIQTASSHPTSPLPVPRQAPAEALERTEIIHRDALVLERASTSMKDRTMEFYREARGFVQFSRNDNLDLMGAFGLQTRAHHGHAWQPHQAMELPKVEISLREGRMLGGNSFAHESFHARVELGEITNPFGRYSSSNPKGMIWEEAMAFKHGFAWEMRMTRRTGENFSDDLRHYLRGGDDWLVRELSKRYGVPLSDALSVLGHITP